MGRGTEPVTPRAMSVIIHYTVFQRTPISCWTSGTAVVDATRRCSFNDLAAEIERDMKLTKNALSESRFLGILNDKMISDKSSTLSVLGKTIQVCIAERSQSMADRFPNVYNG